jgi:Flp pilus assembly protein TadD
MVRYVVGAFALLLAVGAVAKLREAPPPKPPAPVFVHGEGPSASAPETAQLKPSNSAETTSAAAPSASAMAQDASVASDSGGGDSGAVDSGAMDSGATTTSTSDAGAALVDGDAGALATDAGLDAKALKRACQRALDGGKLAQAIENGEASVAADPTDGEAWLLLGAAYDQKGRAADARTAYQSCVQKGKRGPVGECAALLR